MSDLLHGRFRKIKKCGSGGTGEVYKAEDTRLKRTVALKRAHGGTEPERKQKAARLLREAEMLASLDHPNIVTIHDCIETTTSVTLVLEYVHGTPFRDVYVRRAVPQHEFLEYFQQLVSAVGAVHEAGLIHRDINPKNILVSAAGAIKLMDFGLAAAASDPQPRAGGTLGYMAPEALRKGVRPGFGVDIYSLGFLSFQALIGGPAFQRLYGTKNPVEWARWVLSREKLKTLHELESPVSLGLSTIIERMVEKDPTQRYSKISEVLRDLDRLAGRPASPEGPSVRRLLAGLRSGIQGTESTK
ncbi:MAG TPA: serine/threonine-protein kinase [Planctomycetota bacterium]|jgi:serine/threonine protein kinase|nr:serine/threonine-protein kinase [Planctomycetota bacterium]